MENKDYIITATAADGFIRAFVATTKNTVSEAAKRHNTTPVATAALGRLITASAIMGVASLKNEKDVLTLEVRGDGVAGGIVATCDGELNARGYIFNPNIELMEQYAGKLDVGRAVGKGTLGIIMDIGLKEPYSGKIELVSGEIAEDLTYYFAVSEQTPSSVGLGVLVDTDTSVREAGGFIAQLMPDAPEEVISALEKNIAQMPYVTDLLDMGKSPEDILNILLKDLNPVITGKRHTGFKCGCSRNKAEKALIAIGRKELETILEEDKKARLHCHFCNSDYDFDENDLTRLLSQ